MFTREPIELLQLSGRAYNVLVRLDIRYIDELDDLARREILNAKSIGLVTYNQIIKNLTQYKCEKDTLNT